MNTKWSFPTKALFIFFFIYVLLYTASCQFVFTPILNPFWKVLVPSFARAVGFVGEMKTSPNGSGDTSYDYYMLLFFIVISLATTTGIGLVIKNNKKYDTLLGTIVVLVRYFLSFQMINYGLAKLFYLQFVFPTASRLDQALGDFSPMGLLWTFMGYSQPYTVFTGLLEFVGGLLLLTRRTTTFGAMLTFGVMANVMMMNYCYDVPVKLLSTHMVFLAAFLIWLDRKRLLNFLLLNKAAARRSNTDVVPTIYRPARDWIKWSLIVLYLAFSVFRMIKMAENRKANKEYFFGRHDVENFVAIDEKGNQLLEDEKTPWKTFYQSWKGYSTVKTKSDQQLFFRFTPDYENNTLNFQSRTDTASYKLKFESLDSTLVHVYGKFEKDSLSFDLRKYDQSNYLLVKTGFRWVNEYPFNR